MIFIILAKMVYVYYTKAAIYFKLATENAYNCTHKIVIIMLRSILIMLHGVAKNFYEAIKMYKQVHINGTLMLYINWEKFRRGVFRFIFTERIL